MIPFGLCRTAQEVGTATANEGIVYRIVGWLDAVNRYVGIWWIPLIGLVCVLSGALVWWWMLRQVGLQRGIVSQIPSLLAHVHHRKIGLRHHILSGILVFSGLSLVMGFVWARVFSAETDKASYAMTSAGMALGILTFVLVVWTLNQTKRLERLQGERIERFDELTEMMTAEMRNLVKRYNLARDKGSPLFRFIFVTNNPYFGVISFKGEPVATEFKNALDGLRDCVKYAHKRQTQDQQQAGNDDNSRTADVGMRLKIVCADTVPLREFVSTYYTDEEATAAADTIAESEAVIAGIVAAAGPDAVVRAPIPVSQAQFAVIGDVVFEFLLESPIGNSDRGRLRARGTNIKATNRIEDAQVAERFEKFAMFLEELIRSAKAGTCEEPLGEGRVLTPSVPRKETDAALQSKLPMPEFHRDSGSEPTSSNDLGASTGA